MYKHIGCLLLLLVSSSVYSQHRFNPAVFTGINVFKYESNYIVKSTAVSVSIGIALISNKTGELYSEMGILFRDVKADYPLMDTFTSSPQISASISPLNTFIRGYSSREWAVPMFLGYNFNLINQNK